MSTTTELRSLIEAIDTDGGDMRRRKLRRLATIARGIHPDWWRPITDYCKAEGVPFTKLRDRLHPDVLVAAIFCSVVGRSTSDFSAEAVVDAFRHPSLAKPDTSKSSRQTIAGYPVRLTEASLYEMVASARGWVTNIERAAAETIKANANTKDEKGSSVETIETQMTATELAERVAEKMGIDTAKKIKEVETTAEDQAIKLEQFREAYKLFKEGGGTNRVREAFGDKMAAVVHAYELTLRTKHDKQEAEKVPANGGEGAQGARLQNEGGVAILWDDAFTPATNKLLEAGTKGALRDIRGLLSAAKKREHAERAAEGMSMEISDLRSQLAQARSAVCVPTRVEATVLGATELPPCEIKMKPANKVFEGSVVDRPFEVPTFQWDGDNSLVPQVDDNYIFQPGALEAVLYGLRSNTPIWMWGHTGTGKTTLYEQVAARLGWMVSRINFDSDIDRLSLVGRDVLRSEGGATKSEFVHGPLPTAMKHPVMLVLDEMDSARPDCTYVMQRVVENNGLLISENGGEFIAPHPMFRICVTAQTPGHGDDMNIYPSVRPQSQAFLNRFGVKLEVGYMSIEQEAKLIETKTGCPQNAAKQIAHFLSEARKAFTQGRIQQAFSPRDGLAIARGALFFDDMKKSLNSTVFGGCSSMDRAALREIVRATMNVVVG